MTPEEKKYLKTIARSELERRAADKLRQRNTLKAAGPTPIAGLNAAIIGMGEGMSDIYEGISQIAGDEDSTILRKPSEVASRDAIMQELKSDEEYKLPTTAGYIAGLFAEPAGVLAPQLKAKSALSAAKASAATGLTFGALGKADPENENARLINALAGTAAGGLLGPAFYKTGEWWRGRGGKDMVDATDDVIPELAHAPGTRVVHPDGSVSDVIDPTIAADMARAKTARAMEGSVPRGTSPEMGPMPSTEPPALPGPAPFVGPEAPVGPPVPSKAQQMDDMWRARQAVSEPPTAGRDALDATDPRYLDHLAQRDAIRATREGAPTVNMREQLEGFQAERKFADQLKAKYQKQPYKTLRAELVKRGIKPARTKAGAIQQLIGVDEIESGGIKLYSNPLDPELLKDLGKWANDMFYKGAGRRILAEAKQNPDMALGALVGSANGGVLVDEDASVLQKIMAAGVMTAVGATGARGITEVIRRTKGQDALENIKKAFIDNYGLPHDYIKSKRGMRAMRDHIGHQFLEVVKEMDELPMAQRRALYRMMVGEQATTADLRALNTKARDLITRMGQEMVDAGLLDPDVYKRNVATYLHRTPEKYLGQAQKGFGGNRARLNLSEIRGRGLKKTIPKTQMNQLAGEGWYVDTRMSKNLKDKNKVVMRRDFTKEERVAMKEIEDAAFAMAETGKLMANDIAVHRFFDDVAQKFGKTLDDMTPDQIQDLGYKMMPETKVAGTDIHRFGKLAGKHVPVEIHDDLIEYTRIMDEGFHPFGKWYDQALRAWKVGKTALNPVVHTNNVMSNFMLYDLSGSDWKHLASARKHLFRKNHMDDEMVKMAHEYGVFSSDWVTQELGAITPFERSMIRKMAPKISFRDNPMQYITQHMRAGWNVSGGKMIDLYHFEDNVFRLGVFMDRMAKGMSPEDAALEARRWLIDYDINAKGVNVLRRTATPFLSYTYRAMPLLLESMTKRPTKALKWIVLGATVNEIGKNIGEQDSKQERRLMDDRYKGSFFGLPHLQRVGEIDGTGQYLDVTRWIPGGDIFDAQSSAMGIPGIPAPFQPAFGGPLGIAANAYSNIDPFTQKPIRRESQDRNEKIASTAGWIGRQFLPNNPVLPGSYAQDKVLTAFRGGETPLGDRLPPWQAILQVMGVKLRPMDVEKLKLRANMQANREIDDVSKMMYEAERDYQKKAITQEQRDEQIAEHKKRIDKIVKKLKSKTRD